LLEAIDEVGFWFWRKNFLVGCVEILRERGGVSGFARYLELRECVSLDVDHSGLEDGMDFLYVVADVAWI